MSGFCARFSMGLVLAEPKDSEGQTAVVRWQEGKISTRVWANARRWGPWWPFVYVRRPRRDHTPLYTPARRARITDKQASEPLAIRGVGS